MPLPDRAATLASLAPLLAALLCAAPQPAAAQNPATLASETPSTVRPATSGFNYSGANS